jgi:hypothetical protein
VLRCPCCHGGLVYALSTPETEPVLWHWLLQEHTGRLVVERGPIDRLWEIDYCTCTQETPYA